MKKLKDFLKNNKFLIICILFIIVFISILGISITTKLKSQNNNSGIIDPPYKEIKEENSQQVAEVKEYISVEIGEELPNVSSYFVKLDQNNTYEIKYFLNNKELPLDEFTTLNEEKRYVKNISEYEVIITNEEQEYTSKLKVIDTTIPEITLKNVTITEGGTYSAKNFLEAYIDNSGSSSYTISYVDKNKSSYKNPGTYDIAIKVCDESKNCTEKTATLTINKFVLSKVKTITQEVVVKEEVIKYGVKRITKANITYDVYNDGSKKEVKRSAENTTIDQATFNGTTATMKDEGVSTYNTLSTTRDTILKITNSYRTEKNVSSLQIDKNLSIMATIRAIEIAYSGKFSHTRPDGREWATIWFDYFGSEPTGIIIGENLAYGYYSDEDACEGWRNSPGHYENMINGNFTKIGIGKFTFNGKTYWVQLFQS